MNKRDAILAKKTYAARQVKVESKISKRLIEMQKVPNSPTKMAQSKQTQSIKNGSFNNSLESTVRSMDSDTSGFSNNVLPAIDNKGGRAQSRQRGGTIEDDTYSAMDIMALNDSHSGSQLVMELSNRSTTAKTSFRKMQAAVKRGLDEGGTSKAKSIQSLDSQAEGLGELVDTRRFAASRSGNRSLSSRQGSNRAATANSSSRNFDDMFSDDNNQRASRQGARDVNDDNYFMPKVTKFRPDGASLMDVYQSKREDTWSKIIQSQLREDEKRKQRLKEEREKYNEEFGALIKAQMESNLAKGAAGATEDERLAKLQDETSKKTEDMQKGRMEAARNAHQMFINNAVEDIETKRLAREAALIEEITSSTLMVNKAKAAIQEEARKKEASKEYHKKYQDDVYQDNLIRLARKEAEKQRDWAETKQIINKKQAMDDAEAAKRKKENDNRLFKSSEGPAHRIVQEIKERQAVNQDKFYNHLIAQGDQLNLTLMKSEDLQARRERELGQGLQDANLKVIKNKQKMKEEDDINNQRILDTMRQMLRNQELQAVKEREDKTKAGMRYQQELDAQLGFLRQRSMDSLTKTMTDDELKYNSDMLRKLGIKI